MKPKVHDVIRDFTQHDPEMKNVWKIGNDMYVLYRITDIQKGTIFCVRMNSPNHSDGERKNFDAYMVTRASQTIGIWEYRGN